MFSFEARILSFEARYISFEARGCEGLKCYVRDSNDKQGLQMKTEGLKFHLRRLKQCDYYYY